MRGERTQNGIYFRVKSVMEVFKMPNLCYDMKKSQSTYHINQHYKFFNVSTSGGARRLDAGHIFLDSKLKSSIHKYTDQDTFLLNITKPLLKLKCLNVPFALSITISALVAKSNVLSVNLFVARSVSFNTSLLLKITFSVWGVVMFWIVLFYTSFLDRLL